MLFCVRVVTLMLIHFAPLICCMYCNRNKFLGRKFGEVYSLDHDIARFDGYKVQRWVHVHIS
jgi:hypothetical protein